MRISRRAGQLALAGILVLALALALALPGAASADLASEHPAQQLLRCYNQPYSPAPAVFDDFLKSRPTRLHLHSVYWSAKPSTLPLTIFVGLTLSRLDALAAQCASWQGPLSAAVYVPLLSADSQGSGQAAPTASVGEGSAAQAAGGSGTHRRRRRRLLSQQGSSSSSGYRATAEADPAALTYFTAGNSGGGGGGDPGSGVAVSASSRADLDGAAIRLERLFQDAEAAEGGCQLRLLLLTEVVSDPVMASLLPINALRNAAVLPADSPLVAMVDVDLLLSSSLSDLMAAPDKAAQLVAGAAAEGGAGAGSGRRRRAAYVLPAFETARQLGEAEGEAVAAAAARLSHKAQLKELLSGGKLLPFAAQAYARGHNATDYPRWLDTPDTGPNASPYAIQYAVNYEPWFVVDRHANPPYDVRFRGYGWNKVSHVAAVATMAAGNGTGGGSFELVAHPSVWLVHQPHERSSAQSLYVRAYTGHSAAAAAAAAASPATGVDPPSPSSMAAAAKRYHRKVGALRHEALRDMKRGSYKPQTDAGSANCRAALRWWRAAEAAPPQKRR